MQVTAAGTKSWLLRYQVNGRPRHMGLGPVSVVSLHEARLRARAARLQILDGADPIDDRRQRRAEASTASMTFKQAALAVMASREGKWRSAEHRRQWKSTLEQYAFPVIGNVPVAAIDVPLVLRCIEPIWKQKQVTADRTRQRIEAILSWATARGYRRGDNPARWRGHLQHLLPDYAKPVHLAALPYLDAPEFIRALRARDGVAPRALEFTILTACRTGETLGARWDEINGEVWTVPAKRTKTEREHLVPLSKRALEILEALPREHGNASVFIGAKAGQPLHRHAMAELLKTMDVACTVHGFRSTFRDWASECTGYPHEVCEMALAHSIPSKVEAAYRRGGLLEKRARLMADWASYLSAPTPTGDVVPLRKSTADA